MASPNSFNRSANSLINPACSAWFFSTVSSRSESPPCAFFWSAIPRRIEASFFRRSKTSQTLVVVSMSACSAIWRGMWNIKKESRVTVTSEFIHEDYVLFVGFGHEFDDATDEPKSVTSRIESQQRRGWPSAEESARNPQAFRSAGRGLTFQVV